MFKPYNHNSQEWFLLVLHFYSSFQNEFSIFHNSKFYLNKCLQEQHSNPHLDYALGPPLFRMGSLFFKTWINQTNEKYFFSRTNSHPQVLTMISALLFVDYEWCHVLFNNNTVIFLYIIWYYHILLNIHVIHYIVLYSYVLFNNNTLVFLCITWYHHILLYVIHYLVLYSYVLFVQQ